MSEENVEIVRQEYEDFNRTGEVTPERYDPAFEWRDFEGSPQPTRRGIEEWRQWTRDIEEVFGELILEPEELIDAGDQVVAIVQMRARGKGSGVGIEMPFAAVWTFRGGKVISGAAFRSKADALKAAGLSE